MPDVVGLELRRLGCLRQPKGPVQGPSCRASLGLPLGSVKVWQLADRRSVCPATRGKIAA
jgi:hypothetical protein